MINLFFIFFFVSCVFEHKILVTGFFFFRTALGNKSLCTVHNCICEGDDDDKEVASKLRRSLVIGEKIPLLPPR